MFNCISQIENLYGDCDLLKIWESFPTRYQTSNDPCDHIIYNQWIERTPALLDTEMILVNNKNAHAEDQWNLTNYDTDFDDWIPASCVRDRQRNCFTELCPRFDTIQ